MTQKLTRIKGSCHCQNISYDLLWPERASEIPVRNCGCTFCKKHGGAWTSHRGSKMKAKILDVSSVSKYRFGTKTAEFYICRACGVAPFVTSEIDEHQYAVVNVNTFGNIDATSFINTSTNFDGEAKDDRLERRRRNWIPDVVVTTPAP